MSDIRGDDHHTPELNVAETRGEEQAELLAKGKRRAGSEETRQRILDAAQHLFAKHGYDATSTKAIAQLAEVPAGLIFYYFPTKKAVLENLLEERNMFPKLHAVMDVPHDAGIRSTLIQVGLHYLETSKRYPEVPQILLREFRSHPEVKEHFETFREELILLIASYVTRAMNAGELHEGNAQVIARIFLYNLIVTATIARHPDEPQRFVEEIVDVLLSGLL